MRNEGDREDNVGREVVSSVGSGCNELTVAFSGAP